MGAELFERMSVRVIAGIDPETCKLIRAKGLIAEIKTSGICTCKYTVSKREMFGFYYTETLVSIRGPELGGWLERIEVMRPQIAGRDMVERALHAAGKAYRADDKDVIVKLARDLCPCDDTCGSRQRMRFVREALCAYAASRRESTLPEMILMIEDYLAP